MHTRALGVLSFEIRSGISGPRSAQMSPWTVSARGSFGNVMGTEYPWRDCSVCLALMDTAGDLRADGDWVNGGLNEQLWLVYWRAAQVCPGFFLELGPAASF